MEVRSEGPTISEMNAKLAMDSLRRWLRKVAGKATPKETHPEGIETLERRIGHLFADESLLVCALRHRSYVRTPGEGGQATPSAEANERLEFLGDAVLGLATTLFLYQRFPDLPEGELTKRKSVLVSKAALAQCAVQIGLDRHLLLSQMEESAGGRGRRSILGDAFEALLGAMFLDGGLEPVRRFLHGELFSRMDTLTHETTFINYKSLLLEHVQAEGKLPPEYELCKQTGPDHEKLFTVEVRVDGAVLGRGVGRSKKDAEQTAARLAYERLTAAASGAVGLQAVVDGT